MAVVFNPFTGNLDFIDTTAAAGSDTQVQFNDGGLLAGSADLTWDDTGKVLGVGGDVNLDDGGSFTTTLQTITPTANRTISFPDATGTVGLVGGSSGQVIYNNAGAYAGVSTMTFDGTSVTLAGRLINSYTSLASSPAKVFTGTWFTGGTATTTKPHFLIEPAGATSTAWSTSGTGLGVNAASGFAGNLLDLQVNGASRFFVDSTGVLRVGSTNVYTDIRGGNNANTGIKLVQLGGRLTYNSFTQLSWDNGRVGVANSLGFGPTASNAPITEDVVLERDAAGTLAQRNSTNAQTYRLYNSYTDASNYERVAFKWDTNTFKIEPEAAGTGTLRSLAFSANGAASTPPVSLTGTWFTGGTSTTTKPALLIEPTGTTSTAWSTSGTGLGVNAASGFAGNLLDLQVNGASKFSVSSAGQVLTPNGTLSNPSYGFSANTDCGFYIRSTNQIGTVVDGALKFEVNANAVILNGTTSLAWATNIATGAQDVVLDRDAANTLAQRNGTNAQTLRVYGTYTDASNLTRASLSATSTAVTLAAETAGTGADDIPLNLTAAGTGTVKVNSVAEVAVSSTVAGLPATPAVGMLTRVTDASAPAVGSTVAGGGAAAALVWWNGANWTVIGV